MTQCGQCKWCVYRDYGYIGNWTEWKALIKICAKNVHKPFDDFYGFAPEYQNIPNPCPEFVEGIPIHMDFDWENFVDLTDEQKEIWNGVK